MFRPCHQAAGPWFRTNAKGVRGGGKADPRRFRRMLAPRHGGRLFSPDHPMNIFQPDTFEDLNQARRMRARQALLAAAAPAALAIVEVFHPHPGHHLLALDVRTWLTVHYIQVPLFALAAISVATLVDAQAGIAAKICRAALFVFALCFVVFDTAAGLVMGSLVEAARASGRPGAWQAAINAVWTHPIFGGINHPLLALIGRLALSVGAASAALSLYRTGRAWQPALLLALSGCVMYVFPGHSWPGGPLTFGGMAVAIAWLHWARPRMTLEQWGLPGLSRKKPGSQAAFAAKLRQRP